MGRGKRSIPKESGMEVSGPRSLDQRYREAVIGFLSVASKKSGKALGHLPPVLLSDLGASFTKCPLHCKRIEVRAPEGMGERELEAFCLRLEKTLEDNAHLFPALRRKRRMVNNFMGLWPLTRRRRQEEPPEPQLEGPFEDPEGR